MTGSDGYFDERVAASYDEDAAEMFEPTTLDPAVDFLAGIADGGPALELGIGTGRIALPLAERGVPVHGIELSRAMAARLRNKPGGDAIDVTIGDFATTTVDATFSVAYVVFNTIMNLTTQEAQVACFRNVAEHLRTRRLLRGRGDGARAPPAAARRDLQSLPREPSPPGASTSTTSRRRASSPIISRSSTASSSARRCRSGTCGPRSST